MEKFEFLIFFYLHSGISIEQFDRGIGHQQPVQH